MNQPKNPLNTMTVLWNGHAYRAEAGRLLIALLDEDGAIKHDTWQRDLDDMVWDTVGPEPLTGSAIYKICDALGLDSSEVVDRANCPEGTFED